MWLGRPYGRHIRTQIRRVVLFLNHAHRVVIYLGGYITQSEESKKCSSHIRRKISGDILIIIVALDHVENDGATSHIYAAFAIFLCDTTTNHVVIEIPTAILHNDMRVSSIAFRKGIVGVPVGCAESCVVFRR